MPDVRQSARSEHPSDMNSVRRTSERTQDHIELSLKLRDSSELDPQLPFSVTKPLIDGPGRCDGRRAASNCARGRCWGGRRKCQSSHGGLLRSPRAYSRGANARCAEPNTESSDRMSWGGTHSPARRRGRRAGRTSRHGRCSARRGRCRPRDSQYTERVARIDAGRGRHADDAREIRDVHKLDSN
jgi:hypothetical protein